MGRYMFSALLLCFPHQPPSSCRSEQVRPLGRAADGVAGSAGHVTQAGLCQRWGPLGDLLGKPPCPCLCLPVLRGVLSTRRLCKC